MSLYNVLSEYEDSENEQKKLRSLPYAEGILDKTIDPTSLSVEELIIAIKTSCYLNEDSKTLVKELVWKAGQGQYPMFFVKKGCSYTLRKDLDTIIYNELFALYGQGNLYPEEIDIRNIEIQLETCARVGNIRLLNWIKDKKKSIDYDLVIKGALDGDCISVLEWVIYEFKKTGKELEMFSAELLARSCSFELKMFEFLYSNKLLTRSSMLTDFAAQKGKIDTIAYLDEKGYSLSDDICANAAWEGHFDCFKYLHEIKGKHINRYTAEYAVMGGSIEILDYIYQKYPGIFQEVHPYCIESYIIGKNRLEILRYLSDRDVYRNTRVVEDFCDRGFADCLLLALEKGYPTSEKCGENACLRDKFDCLQILIEHKVPLSPRCMDIVVAKGNFDCAYYLNHLGIPFPPVDQIAYWKDENIKTQYTKILQEFDASKNQKK